MRSAIERANEWILKFPTNNEKLTAEDLVSQFHEDELAAMKDINESNGNDYTYVDECDMAWTTVSYYVQDWLMEQIADRVHSDTDHLFEVYKMLCW